MLEEVHDAAQYLDEGQWQALADEIGKPLPKAAVEGICNALIIYDGMGVISGPRTIDRAALKQIVKHAEKLKSALQKLSPEIFLSGYEAWAAKVDQLGGIARNALEAMPRGRPPTKIREDLILRIAEAYEQATNRHAGVSRNSSTGRVGGPFYRFAEIILETQSIDPACIRPAIEKRNKQIATDEDLS